MVLEPYAPFASRPFFLAVLALTACATHRAPEVPSTRPPAKLDGPELLPPPADLSDAARKEKVLEALPDLEKQFAEYREKQKLPGLAVGIVVGSELVYAKGFGARELETNAPVDPNTLFRIASMTKSFTALAILRLRDEGKLSLEDPIGIYIPELGRVKSFTRDSAAITVREILSHSAGFPEDNAWGDPRLDLTDQEFSTMLRRGLSFSSAPGTAYEYSNLGFGIAGRIIQRVSRMRYQDYVSRYILKPLKMTSTTWDKKNVPAERLAKGYERQSGPWSFVSPQGPPGPAERALPQLSDGAFASMGGLYTSIRDFARYVSFQLSAWPPRDDPERGPVRRSSVREAQQVVRYHRLFASRPSVDESIRATAWGYGLGWGVSENCNFERVISHGGGLPGFGSFVSLYTDQNVGVFAFANATYAGLGQLVEDAVKTLSARGAMEKRRTPISPALGSAEKAVLPLLEHWDDSLAAKLFDKTFFQYNPPERLHWELETLHQQHGRCQTTGEISPLNALRGRFQLACDRGQIDVQIALTPDEPSRIQWVALRDRLPPNERMIKISRQVAREIGHSSHQSLDALLAPSLDRNKVHRQLEAAGRGPCDVTRWVDGDGDANARFEVACGGEALELSVQAEASGQVASLTLGPRRDPRAKCPP
jgi:CubicO group peptidase (beta-lactamase class C family)